MPEFLIHGELLTALRALHVTAFLLDGELSSSYDWHVDVLKSAEDCLDYLLRISAQDFLK